MSNMNKKCPGSEIQITEKKCPHCGSIVELFTGEYRVKCPKCSCLVYRDKASCAEWCPMADECFGPTKKVSSK